jgi:hypothetical protein
MNGSMLRRFHGHGENYVCVYVEREGQLACEGVVAPEQALQREKTNDSFEADKPATLTLDKNAAGHCCLACTAHLAISITWESDQDLYLRHNGWGY